MSNQLEQFQFKFEKILGFRNMQEKLKNVLDSYVICFCWLKKDTLQQRKTKKTW